jgi:hypothetical protein
VRHPSPSCAPCDESDSADAIEEEETRLEDAYPGADGTFLNYFQDLLLRQVRPSSAMATLMTAGTDQ